MKPTTFAAEHRDRGRRRPAPAVSLRDAEHQRREPGGDEDRARCVEPLTVLVEALREEEGAQNQRRDSDRHVHEEDPRPREVLDEDAAEQHAERGTDATDGTPAAQCDVPLAAFLEGRNEDRQRSRRDGCRTESLERSEGDERRLTPGESAEKRAEREDGDAEHEHAPTPQQIGRPSSEQEKAAEDERVCADHPLEVLLREPEIGLNGRERDVDDRDIEDGHELHREDQRECKPLFVVGADHGTPRFECACLRVFVW